MLQVDQDDRDVAPTPLMAIDVDANSRFVREDIHNDVAVLSSSNPTPRISKNSTGSFDVNNIDDCDDVTRRFSGDIFVEPFTSDPFPDIPVTYGSPTAQRTSSHTSPTDDILEVKAGEIVDVNSWGSALGAEAEVEAATLEPVSQRWSFDHPVFPIDKYRSFSDTDSILVIQATPVPADRLEQGYFDDLEYVAGREVEDQRLDYNPRTASYRVSSNENSPATDVSEGESSPVGTDEGGVGGRGPETSMSSASASKASRRQALLDRDGGMLFGGAEVQLSGNPRHSVALSRSNSGTNLVPSPPSAPTSISPEEGKTGEGARRAGHNPVGGRVGSGKGLKPLALFDDVSVAVRRTVDGALDFTEVVGKQVVGIMCGVGV